MSAKKGWRAWRVSEERVLRELFPTKGAQAVAEALGRTRMSVNSMARRLGVKCDRSSPRTLEAIRARCEVEEEPSGCWIWAGATGGLHHTPRLHAKGNKTIVVRRFVWELVHGEPPAEGRYVVARCRCSMCVNPEHLRLITPQQHVRQALREKPKSRASHVQGVLTRIRNGNCTLDWEKAAQIRLMDGTCKEVAEQYGVTPSMVSCIRRGKAWREPAGIGALM